MDYKEMQNVAKQTIEYITTIIKPGMSLSDVRKYCENKMFELGADSFWYWNVGAFVFSGDETAISISGKHYITSDKVIQNSDIITIDLSPQCNNIWGDYARTIIIEDGYVVENIEDVKNNEWKNGMLMEATLHTEMKNFVGVDTTFEQLFYHMNEFIVNHGYINLDFLGNLGHSIVENSDERIFIEKGNKKRLSDVAYFTFEPHISIKNSLYGYKKENIYYFSNGNLMEL